MTPTPIPTPSREVIPSLELLGDRLQAAAAMQAAQSRRRGPRTAMTWLSLTAAAATVVLVIGLLVGVDSGKPVAAEVVTSATQRTVDAGTASFSVALSSSPTQSATGVVLRGRYDLGADLAAAEADFEILLAMLAGPSTLNRLDDVAGAGSKTGLGELVGPADLVIDDSTAYVRSSALSLALGVPDGWVQFSLDEVGGVADAADGAAPLAPTDAAALLELLGGVEDPVRSLGEEQIDGVTTHRYAGVVDPTRAVDVLEASAPDGSQGAIGAAARAAIDDATPIPFEVWIDDDGHVRRISSQLAVPVLGSATLTVDYSLIGDPVEIEVPDPVEITEVSDALAALVGDD